MAISYLGSQTTTLSGVASPLLGFPNGVTLQAGDVLVAYSVIHNTSTTELITSIADSATGHSFTSLNQVTHNSVGLLTSMYYYVWQSNDSTSNTWKVNTAATYNGDVGMAVYRGVLASSPIDNTATPTAQSTAGTTVTVPSVTANTTGTMLVAVVGAYIASTSFTSSTLTQRIAHGNGGNNTTKYSDYLGDLSVTNAGATGTNSVTISSAAWNAHALTLKPIPPNTAPTVALNTPTDTSTVSTATPQLTFTGTDADGNPITYEAQIDTVNTFDSQSGAATPAVVQHAITANTVVADGSGNAVGPSWSQTTAAGNLLVATLNLRSASVTVTCSTAGWVKAATVSNTTGAINTQTEIWYKANSTGSDATPTFVITASLAYSVAIAEVSGIATSSPLDQTGTATASGASVSLTVPVSSATTGSGEFVYAGMGIRDGSNLALNWSSFSAGGSATFQSALDQNNTAVATSPALAHAWALSAAAATTPSITGVTSGGASGSTYAFAIASFKAGTVSAPLLDKTSVADTGFTDITNGAGTSPYASGDQIGYTVQSALTSGTTYYWRVRGKDPTGSNTFGSWSSTNRFTVSSGPTPLSINVSDSSTVSEAVSVFIPFFAPTLSDSVTSSEAVALNVPVAVSVTDSTTTSETVSTALALLISKSESVTVMAANYVSLLNSPYAFSYFDGFTDGSNIFGNLNLYSAQSDYGVTIIGNGSTLSSIVVHLYRTGATTGNATALIYAITGTPGNNAVPTGSVLATSDPLDTSTLTTLTSGANYTFTFSGANKIALTDTVNYAVTIHYTGSTSSSIAVNVAAGYDHVPNNVNDVFYSTSWNVLTGESMNYWLYGAKPVPIASDSIIVSDTPIVLISNYNLNVSDSITTSDSPALTSVYQVAVADSTATSENIQPLTTDNLSVSDATTLTETISRVVINVVTVSDSSATSENLTVNILSAPQPNITVSDSTTLSESVAVIEAWLNVNVADSTTTSESLARLAQNFVAVSDTASSSETLGVLVPFYNLAVSDGTTVSESLLLQDQDGIAVLDNVSTSDVVSSIQTVLPIKYFADDFGTTKTADTLLYYQNTSTSTTTQTGNGTISISVPANTNSNGTANFGSVPNYDLRGDGVYIQLTAIGNQDVTNAAHVYALVVAGAGSSSGQIWFEIWNNNIHFYYYNADGINTQAGSAIAYSATTHKWFRIRQDSVAGGTVYWDTSADGVNWTNQVSSTAVTWDVEFLYPWAGVSQNSSTLPAETVSWTNFNAPSRLSVAVSDSSTLSESLNVVIPTLFIAASDSTTASESLSLNPQSFVQVADSTATSESVAVAAPLTASVADGSAISETLAIAIVSNITVADSTTSSETISVVPIAPPALSINVNDSVSLSETVLSPTASSGAFHVFGDGFYSGSFPADPYINTIYASYLSYGSAVINISLPGGVIASPGVASHNYYDITNDAVYVKFSNFGTISANYFNVLQVVTPGGDYFGIRQYNGTIYMQRSLNGGVTTAGNTTFNASTMAWWRIRENAGTTYYETSADGVTWTAFYSEADPGISLGVLRAQATVNTNGTAGTGDTASISNFNVPSALAITVSDTVTTSENIYLGLPTWYTNVDISLSYLSSTALAASFNYTWGQWQYNAADWPANSFFRIETIGWTSSTSGQMNHQLYDVTANALVPNTLISDSSGNVVTNYTNTQSTSNLVDGHYYAMAFWSNSASYTTYLIRASITMMPPLTPVGTRNSYVTLAGYNSFTNTTASTFTGYAFTYSASKWDGSPTFQLESMLRQGGTTGTTNLQLYDVTAGAAVTGSTISTTSPGTVQIIRSGNITLTDGHQYVVQAWTTNYDGTNSSRFDTPRLKVTQTNPTLWSQQLPLSYATWNTTSTSGYYVPEYRYIGALQWGAASQINWTYNARIATSAAGGTAYVSPMDYYNGTAGSVMSTTSTSYVNVSETFTPPSSWGNQGLTDWWRENLSTNSASYTAYVQYSQYILDVSVIPTKFIAVADSVTTSESVALFLPNYTISVADAVTTSETLTSFTDKLNITVSDSVATSETYKAYTVGQPELISTYPDSNNWGGLNQHASTQEGYGVNFVGDGSRLSSAVVYQGKTGAPTGLETIKVYAATGTPGTNATPTGAALASATYDVSTIGASGTTAVKVTFTGANQIVLQNGANYFLTVEYNGGNSSNYIFTDNGGTNVPSNVNDAITSSITTPSWTALTGESMCYQIYGVLPEIALSDSITTSDTPQVLIASNVSVSDNVATSESLAVSNANGINVQDSVTLSEARTLLIPTLFIAVSDNVVTSDAPTLLIPQLFISVADAAATSEALLLQDQDGIAVLENVATSESLTLLIPTLLTAVADSTTTSEALQRMVESYVANTDAVTLSETLALYETNYNIAVSDSTATSESVKVEANSFISVNNSVVTSEAVVVIEPFDVVQVSDSSTVSEVVTPLIPTLYVAVSDTATTSESTLLFGGNGVFVSDNVTVSESVTLGIAYVTSMGPQSPTTATNNTGAGSYGWANTGNVFAQDSQYATATGGSSGGGTNYLFVQGFTFDIPSAATVTGITATIWEYDNWAGGATESTVQLLVNGVLSGNNKASVTTSGTNTAYTKGSSTDTWGLSLTGADVNNPNFGIALAYNLQANTKPNEAIFVDYVSLTVNYTSITPPPTSTTLSDSVTTSESKNVAIADQINVADSTVTSESRTVLVPFYALSVSDAVTTSDSVTVFEPFLAVNASDAVTTSDSVTSYAQNFVSATDATTLSESLTVKASVQLSVADSTTLSETLNFLVLNSIAVADSTTASEVVSLLIPLLFIAVSDNSTVGDQAFIAEPESIVAIDNVSTSEAITVAPPLVQISVTDSSSLTDVAALTKVLLVNTSDSTTTSETVTFVANNFVSVADSSSVAETLSELTTNFISSSDSSSVTDIANIAPPLVTVVVSDSTTTTDTVSTAGSSYVSVSDSSTHTESISRLVENYVSVSDSSTHTETAVANFSASVNVSDSSTVTATNTQYITSLFIAVSDNVTTSEVSAIYDGEGTFVLENVITSETVSVYVGETASVSDSASVSDNVLITLIKLIATSDSVTASETPNFLVSNYTAVADGVSVTDSATVRLQSYVHGTDSVTVTDSSATDLQVSLSVSDSMLISDVHVVAEEIKVSGSDAVSVSAAAELEVDAYVHTSDTATTSDSSSTDVVTYIINSDSAFASEALHVINVYDIHTAEYVAITETLTARPDVVYPLIINIVLPAHNHSPVFMPTSYNVVLPAAASITVQELPTSYNIVLRGSTYSIVFGSQ